MKRWKLRWSRRALADLQGFHEWLSTLESAKPAKTIARIRASAKTLQRLGDIGRPGAVEGVREFSVRNAPYVLVYSVDGDVIEIVAVYHTAQNR